VDRGALRGGPNIGLKRAPFGATECGIDESKKEFIGAPVSEPARREQTLDNDFWDNSF
jgi:hypothetical protein